MVVLDSKVPILLLVTLFAVASFSFAFVGLNDDDSGTVGNLENKLSNLENKLERKNRLILSLRENLEDKRISKKRLRRLRENLETVLREYKRLKKKYSRLMENYENLRTVLQNYEGLKEKYSTLLENRLVTIPYTELKTFLKRNEVDENEYVAGNHLFSENTYDCAQFSNDLYMAAIRKGYRVAIVNLVLEGNIGHSMNAFEVTNGSVVFVEPQTDTIFYEPLKPGVEWNGKTIKKTVIRWPDNKVVYG